MNMQSNHDIMTARKGGSFNQFVASPRIPGSKRKILLENPEGSGDLKKPTSSKTEKCKKVLRKGSDYIARSDK